MKKSNTIDTLTIQLPCKSLLL